MTYDYRALAALDAIIEHGSFERAAAALSISQPAVSHRLRALEQDVGELLVVRGHPPQATARGERLIAHYRQVALLEAGLDAGALPPAQTPRLAIAVNADSAATWLLEHGAAHSGQARSRARRAGRPRTRNGVDGAAVLAPLEHPDTVDARVEQGDCSDGGPLAGARIATAEPERRRTPMPTPSATTGNVATFNRIPSQTISASTITEVSASGMMAHATARHQRNVA